METIPPALQTANTSLGEITTPVPNVSNKLPISEDELMRGSKQFNDKKTGNEKLPISEEELKRGSRQFNDRKIGNIKFLYIFIGVIAGFLIKLALAFLNYLLPGIYYLYFPFAILSFILLLSIGKEYKELYYLSIGLLIAMVL